MFAPTYDSITENLYLINFVSCDEPSIFRFNVRYGEFYSANIIGRNSPSLIIPIQKKNKKIDELFAVAVDREVLIVSWDGISENARVVDTLFSVDSINNSSRINYGRTDSKGRLYFGSISQSFCDCPGQQSFYRYIAGEGVVRLSTSTYSTAGIAINEDAETLYLLDFCTLFLTEYDWDPVTGDICIQILI